ncbi:hypothetical protein BX600DRAFT_201146 [Xylariales sp. PMI_506]|nr:hypothetical protein BX600DRAFT_201146 [Xylariales sp. PMI_506]
MQDLQSWVAPAQCSDFCQYFSTLERLRFAQNSGSLNAGTPNNKLPNQPSSFTFSHAPPKKSCGSKGQRGLEALCQPLSRSQTLPISQQDTISARPQPSSTLASDSLVHAGLSREQQLALARSLRQSVILDAAGEAIHKISPNMSQSTLYHAHSTSLSSSRPSMEAQSRGLSSTKTSKGLEVRDEIYSSFKWLEEEELDLSLYVDDYHSNLRETLPDTKAHRPSFRRHLSITKIPFGRSSFSTTRLVNQDLPSTPASPSPSSMTHPSYGKRRSRALSLRTPRHGAQESVSSIDPDAMHYQDPEARLRLRAYLATPQKFDEAIEFGFPSNDVMAAQASERRQPLRRGNSRRMLSEDSEKFKTFLSDDRSSTYSEDISSPEPETPRTPQEQGKHAFQPLHVPEVGRGHQHAKVSGSFVQVPASPREMTMRMTLTRPDLRACDDEIYGWQRGLAQQNGRASPFPDDLPPRTTYLGAGNQREDFENFFASLDDVDGTVADGGVVKRIWNKVRRI